MKMVVIGIGCVGLVLGAGFTDIGHNVTCVDNNPKVLDRLNRGEIPIDEPGLVAVVGCGVAADHHRFAESLIDMAADADVVFRTTLVDFRNLFDPDDAVRSGLSYHSIGRRPALLPTA